MCYILHLDVRRAPHLTIAAHRWRTPAAPRVLGCGRCGVPRDNVDRTRGTERERKRERKKIKEPYLRGELRMQGREREKETEREREITQKAYGGGQFSDSPRAPLRTPLPPVGQGRAAETHRFKVSQAH